MMAENRTMPNFAVGDRVIFVPRKDVGVVEASCEHVVIRFVSGCFGIYDTAWFDRHKGWIIKEAQ